MISKYLKPLTQTKLIIFTSIFLVCFDNYKFFVNILEVYPLNIANAGFLLSIIIILLAFIVLLFSIITSRHTIKPTLIIILLTSSLTNYFMNTYGTIIDDDMIRNMLQTETSEAMDLVTFKQIIYLLILGVIPSILIYKVPIHYRPLKDEVISKMKAIFIPLLIIIILLLLFSKHYTSFFRENKPLRYSTNPTYWIYSIGHYINQTFTSTNNVLEPLGRDARIDTNSTKHKIVIMVVGEAARADHFSLNGYTKETNPLLSKENIINFSQLYSCGTSTAISVPCMFSYFTRDDFDYNRGVYYENALDVLSHTQKIAILWRDNNSNSKNVANRLSFENFKTSNTNTICTDGECRDEGMLIGLDAYITKNNSKDILIVLHQMGNHGPAYYKRYPNKFEIFKPTCKTNQIEKCTKEEISNAYDNAILYTDYFLTQTIDLLKQYEGTHKTAMIYMSDHGESLGENGIYLHGLPYFMAPDAQKHVGALAWFNKEMSDDMNITKITKNKDKEFSHDNLFHTLLDIFDVNTDVYEKNMSMFR
ncbi:MAG: phosphoethanolamine--lipid A transferase [Sulfurimonas sp.]|nr:phosphoethanolamine--lipid A transferase [Sulfurimonas sp.]MDQ7061240.1 phosphoethanolamine--lipid A transferase [Sulfurimonas sp.]